MPGHLPASVRVGAGPRGRSAGFTLIEIAVVMLILAIVLGMIGINLTQGTTDLVRDEGRRLALLLQTAQQESILEGRFYAFVPASDGYQFLRLNNEGELVPVEAGDVLGPRALPDAVSLELVRTSGEEDSKEPLILFDPAGSLADFTLALRAGDSSWYVQSLLNGKIHSAPVLADAG